MMGKTEDTNPKIISPLRETIQPWLHTPGGERNSTVSKSTEIGQGQQKKGLTTRARRHASTPQYEVFRRHTHPIIEINYMKLL